MSLAPCSSLPIERVSILALCLRLVPFVLLVARLATKGLTLVFLRRRHAGRVAGVVTLLLLVYRHRHQRLVQLALACDGQLWSSTTVLFRYRFYLFILGGCSALFGSRGDCAGIL